MTLQQVSLFLELLCKLELVVVHERRIGNYNDSSINI